MLREKNKSNAITIVGAFYPNLIFSQTEKEPAEPQVCVSMYSMRFLPTQNNPHSLSKLKKVKAGDLFLRAPALEISPLLQNLIFFHCCQLWSHNEPELKPHRKDQQGVILPVYWTTPLTIIPLEVDPTLSCYWGGIKPHVDGLEADVTRGQEVVGSFFKEVECKLEDRSDEWKMWLSTSKKWKLLKMHF